MPWARIFPHMSATSVFPISRTATSSFLTGSSAVQPVVGNLAVHVVRPAEDISRGRSATAMSQTAQVPDESSAYSRYRIPWLVFGNVLLRSVPARFIRRVLSPSAFHVLTA